MAEISIESEAGGLFRVTVADSSGSTTHQVTAGEEDLGRFGGTSPEELVEESFRFLLEREPKEAILRRFELRQIADYFPDYPDEIRRRLGS